MPRNAENFEPNRQTDVSTAAAMLIVFCIRVYEKAPELGNYGGSRRHAAANRNMRAGEKERGGACPIELSPPATSRLVFKMSLPGLAVSLPTRPGLK